MTRVQGTSKPASSLEAGFLLFFLLFLAPLGCNSDGEPPPDPELEGAGALGLGRGARLHTVVLGGRGAEEHVLPERLQVRPGDAVEFVTVDHRVHRVVFDEDSLEAEVMEFLAGAGVTSSPPLTEKGSRFLLRLEGAPRGRYPFVSYGHGGAARGVIQVGADSVSGPR